MKVVDLGIGVYVQVDARGLEVRYDGDYTRITPRDLARWLAEDPELCEAVAAEIANVRRHRSFERSRHGG